MNYRGEWLTRSEFSLLTALLENEGTFMPGTALYAAASGYVCPDGAVCTHIYNLRAKLRPYGLDTWIVARRPLGYSWRNPDLTYPRSVYVDLLAWRAA